MPLNSLPKKQLSPEDIARLWRQHDYAKAPRDEPEEPDEPETPQDPWRLEMNEQEADRLRKSNQHLWQQLIERGFIDSTGRASRRWINDERNRQIAPRRTTGQPTHGPTAVVRNGVWVIRDR